MLSSLAAAFRSVLRRMRADWLIVTATFATVMLATIVLASGPIYADAVTTAALQRSLADAPVTEASVRVEAKVFPDHYEEVDALVRDTVAGSFHVIDFTIHPHLEADAYELVGGSSEEATTLVSFQSFEGIETRADLSEGVWPEPDSREEVAVHAPAAAALGIGVGDTLEVSNRRDGQTATVSVVGVYEPTDRADPFWFDDPLALTGQVDSGSFRTYGPFVMPAAALFATFTPLRTNADWRVVPDFESLAVSEVGSLLNATATLQDDLDRALQELPDSGPSGVSGFIVTTGMADLLADVDRSLSVTRASVIALLAQLAILAGYALVLTAGLLADTRRTETALARSRGAAPAQLTAMAVLEGLVLTLPAVLFGPFLVTLLLRILNVVGPLAAIDLSIDPTTNSEAYYLAAIAAVLSIVALAWPAYRSARSFGAQTRRSRRQRTVSGAQRAGVDIALLALAVIVFWQLGSLGTQISARVQGRFGVDPLLVIAPALALLAGAVLGLRFVPLLARVAERLAASRSPIVGTLASWQVARRPLRYARSSLLLMLAVGIGVFAVTYSTTWLTSQTDQAGLANGADVTVTPNQSANADIGELQLVNAHLSVPDVSASMPFREQLGQLGGGTQGQFVMLDADTAPGVVAIREDLDPDFAGHMATLASGRPDPETLDLPGEPSAVTLTLDAVEEVPEDGGQCDLEADGRATCFRGRVWVVIEDGSGLLHRIDAGMIPVNEGPAVITVGLTDESDDGSLFTPVYPISLLNVEIESVLPGESRLVHLTILQIGVVTGDGSDQPVLADFPEWTVASTATPGADISPQIGIVAATPGSLTVDVETGSGFGAPPTYFSLRPRPPALPGSFPVLVSEGFLTTYGVTVGDSLTLPPLRIPAESTVAGTLAGFPTVNPSVGETVVMDLATYQHFAYEPGFRIPGPDQYWLAVEGDDETVVTTLGGVPFSSQQVSSRQDLLDRLVTDPVALGTIGALTIGFVAAVVFAAVGFAVSATVSARERLIEFALIRALGLTGRQLGVWLSMEQGVLVLVGLGLGTLIGVVLTATVLPLITLTQDGQPAMPPVVVEYPWTAIIGMELAVIAVLGVIVVAMTVLLRRIGLGSLLRLGED